MDRYKPIATDPKLLAVDLGRQLLPGTIEHKVNYLFDHAVDLSRFDARFRNDNCNDPLGGAPPRTRLTGRSSALLYEGAEGIIDGCRVGKMLERRRH